MYPTVISSFDFWTTHHIVANLQKNLDEAIDRLNIEITKNSHLLHRVSARYAQINLTSDPEKKLRISAIRFNVEFFVTFVGQKSEQSSFTQRGFSIPVGLINKKYEHELPGKCGEFVSMDDAYHSVKIAIFELYAISMNSENTVMLT